MRCSTGFSGWLGLLILLSLGPWNVALAQGAPGGGHEHGEGRRHRSSQPSGEQPNADGADGASMSRRDGGHSREHGRERLSTEELRQIRRDIDTAGRDIYRRDRGGRGN